MRVKSAYFEITNRCNLNCKTCYNRSGLNTKRKEISKAQLKKAIELLIPFGVQRILLSGGEPTVHTEFNEILDLIDEYPELSFGIVTNGTVCNQKLIDRLNDKGDITLQISLDGSNEEQNSKTRGKGSFEKTLSLATKIHSPGEKPLLKMVISQSNFDDIEDFYKLAISIGFVPEFAFIYRSGNGSDKWEDKQLTAQQKLLALRLIDKLNKEYNTSAVLPLCTIKCPYVKSTEDLSLCIKTNGSIQPCQTLYSDAYSIGNIFHFDMDYNTQRINWISNIAKKRYETDYNCNSCLLREGCGKGCMAMAVNLYNDPLAKDGDCRFRKLQFIGYSLRGVK
jgi:radical SAM protein with 4Fe4S-binding SPASM domain